MIRTTTISIILILFTLASCNSKKASSPDNPNILFIFADDQCFETIHALGNSEIKTPTLDELVRNGTVFTSAYNMGGWHGAVCVASRTMFTTGKFLWNANKAVPKLDSLSNKGQLWSQVMDSLGYDTYMTGKWHVRIRPEQIFNTVGSERPGMPGSHKDAYNRPLSKDDNVWTPWDSAYGGFWKGGTHWSEVVANETMGFLDSAAVSDNPFFMYVAFNAPHDPRQSPKEYVDMYPLENIAVPDNFLPEYPYKDEIGCPWSLRDEKLAPMPRTEYAVKVHRQEYYAIISHMDHQISRILDYLEQTGQKDNTYIFFSADHGLACGQHGLLGKQNMYEHSMKPPMIVVGPDIPKGEERNMNVYLQDIMPTVIEYAGGRVPEYVEFNSLKALIEKNRAESYYPAVYGAYRDRQRMIRMDDFKLIIYPYAGVVRLFDLENDPLEMNDLADNPAQEQRVKEMFTRFTSLQQSMNDTLDMADFEFRF